MFLHSILLTYDSIMGSWIDLNRYALTTIAKHTGSIRMYQFLNCEMEPTDRIYRKFVTQMKNAHDVLYKSIPKTLEAVCYDQGARSDLLEPFLFEKRYRRIRATRILHRFLRTWVTFHRTSNIKNEIYLRIGNQYFFSESFRHVYLVLRHNHDGFIHIQERKQILHDLLYFYIIAHPVTLVITVGTLQLLLIDYSVYVFRGLVHRWVRNF